MRRPYPHSNGTGSRFLQAVLFGLFVFLFLFLFEPFGIGEFGDDLPVAAAGFGIVTTGCMCLLNVLFPVLFKGWYDSESWTVAREILQTILNIVVIGAGNMLFYALFFEVQLTLARFLWFQASTALVGAFPVTVYVLIVERTRRRRYENAAAEITASLPASPAAPSPQTITLPGAEGRAPITIPAGELLFFQSTGNYADVLYHDKSLRRLTIRSTLRAIEESLQNDQRFVRCHRRYIVNLQKVRRISGNAQGYKLHLEGTEEIVPVSRQQGDLLKRRLGSR